MDRVGDRPGVGELAEMLGTAPWLTLATIDSAGMPLATYAPYALVPNAFGIVVSGLAAHTQALLEQRRVSVLVVDVQHADSNYARPRVTVDCAVDIVSEAVRVEALWSALERRHGAVVQTLRTLPDFRALALVPLAARLVLGFGAARDVTSMDVIGAIEAAREAL